MEIGINLFCLDTNSITIDEKIDLMKKNDFYHTFARSDDASLDNDAFDKIKKSGIVFDFLHLPFKNINSLYFNCEDAFFMLKSLNDGIEKCSMHEIPLAILHLSSGAHPPFNDLGMERYKALIEKARALGVKIAFENLRTLGNISLAVETFEDALFCWDTGHESCFTPGRQYMPLFGSKLAALHLHDNSGIYDKDEHMIPYDGNIDFNRVAKQLFDVNYNGTLMLEVVKSRSPIYEKMTNQEYYSHASKAAKKLLNQIQTQQR
jgi:sugar phosphate isomerase/epimerase